MQTVWGLAGWAIMKKLSRLAPETEKSPGGERRKSEALIS